MKKIVICLVVMMSFILTVSGQTSSRFPILPTSVWRVNYEYNCSGLAFVHEQGDEEYKYFVDGDTLIDGRTYFRLFKSGIIYLDSPFEYQHKYVGALRDSSNRFFYVEKSKTNEILLYNFEAGSGEVICQSEAGMNYYVLDVAALENGRKRYIVDVLTVHCGSTNTLIEGIGWLGGLLEGNACYYHPGIRGSYLLCYSENGVSEYLNTMARCGEKMECNIDLGSSSFSYTKPHSEIMVFPGQFIQVKLPGDIEGKTSVQVYDLSGAKVIEQDLSPSGLIDGSSLRRGTYLLRLNHVRSIETVKFRIW